jgi:hypothetical protein
MHHWTDHRLKRRAASASVALSLLLMTTANGWPQTAPPSLGLQSPAQQSVPPASQQQAEPPAQPAPPAREENPGLINELGKLWDKSISVLPKIKSPSETLEDIRGAGDSLTNMARPSTMVSGRAACVVAANGAPDCKAGADRLCQTKGFKEGKSLDTDAAEKCSAKAYIPGRKREPGDCKTENYVIKALCQ